MTEQDPRIPIIILCRACMVPLVLIDGGAKCKKCGLIITDDDIDLWNYDEGDFDLE